VREFRVNQSCTILRRPAFGATGAPANQLMQLMFQKFSPGLKIRVSVVKVRPGHHPQRVKSEQARQTPE